MTTWTKELPKEDGLFWYRHSPTAIPEVVEWCSAAKCAERHGSECPYYETTEYERYRLEGEFWPIKLEPPDTAPDWVEALPTMFNSPRRPLGMPSINFPPLPIKVELDPNHPHA